MSVDQARLQFRIADRLQDELEAGEALMQRSVVVPDREVRTDVAWASPERRQQLETTDEPLAPEICVEVLPSEEDDPIPDLRKDFFEAGAEEVWICDPTGSIRFFGPGGERDASEWVPGFPATISP